MGPGVYPRGAAVDARRGVPYGGSAFAGRARNFLLAELGDVEALGHAWDTAGDVGASYERAWHGWLAHQSWVEKCAATSEVGRRVSHTE